MLNIVETQVTEHGERLAIEHLPNLELLDGRSSLQIVADMLRTCKIPAHGFVDPDSSSELLEVPCLELKDLHCVFPDKDCPYVCGDIAAAIQLCPFVMIVTLAAVDGVGDEDVAALRHLDRLCNLNLQSLKNVSFEGGVLPILQTLGSSSLNVLALRRLKDINLGSIVKYCQKLRSLTLEDIISFSPPSRRTPKPVPRLSHLEDLRVGSSFGTSNAVPSASDLSFLLASSPNLVKLKVNKLGGFTDQVMEKAATCHGFAKLQVVKLERCEKITKTAIDVLLTLASPLKKIKIEYCEGILKRDCKAWQKKIRRSKRNLSITRVGYWD